MLVRAHWAQLQYWLVSEAAFNVYESTPALQYYVFHFQEKTGVVNSPKTATPPVASPPMTLSTPQHELDLNHDTQLGFQAMHFLSVLLLKCAAWVAQTDFEHVVAAFLQERAYRFVSGRWGLDAVEAPLKCPRVLITLVDQTYTVQGGCDWVRRIFLIQPENKSFQHVTKC